MRLFQVPTTHPKSFCFQVIDLVSLSLMDGQKGEHVAKIVGYHPTGQEETHGNIQKPTATRMKK
jgi:hypothetical protein